MNKILAIVGAGGFGREILPVAHSQVDQNLEVVFVDDAQAGQTVSGARCISELEFINLKNTEKYFNVAIGDSSTRAMVAERFLANKIEPLQLQAPNSLIYMGNTIAEGAVFCANTVVTSNTKIGKFFQCNLNSYVAHDCVIGDYVTFAPGVHCNGNVYIDDYAYIGTGAIIRQGTSEKPLIIGKGAVVGMGAVVTKDVEPYTTVIGNPARPM